MTTDNTPSDPRGSDPAGVSAVLATLFTTVGFFAFAILGLGVLSFFADVDIISVPGLGPVPAALGMISAIACFAALIWSAVRVPRPRYRPLVAIALLVSLMHLLAVAFAALLVSGELITALAVMGDLVTNGASLVVAAAALVAAAGGVAMRRTRGGAPRWPWEDDEGEPNGTPDGNHR
ncbi:hypothetical protein [uncultured Microbacterium sp.]|uniref:hypothetical protein n=1 Tax=uncultured Microbacterium sp. TaxID=191216 RepID=UPI0026139149|nr:hypothetical protein [uncultured Microbacterium sp.]